MTDVIIIGAGVAGLSAAAELANSGLHVQILEARDRLGGRVHTIHDPLSAMPIELGAEFVHGLSGHLWDLITGVPLLVGAAEGESLMSTPEGLAPRHEFWEAWAEIVKRMDLMTEDDLPFDEFMTRYASDLDEETRRPARAFVQGFNAADPARVSTRWLHEGEKVAEEVGEGNFRMLRGYDQVVDALRARAFGMDLRLNTAVREIRWERGKASVHAHATHEEFTARAVVLTVPVSLLHEGQLRFSPELPDKLSAASQIQMGPVVRITFRFRERFWEDEHPDLSFLLSSDPVLPTWWTSLPAIVPLLTGWAAGPAAAPLCGKPPHEVADEALGALSRILNMDRARLDSLVAAWYTHDWQQDPYSRGAYSWVPSGCRDATARLAAPVEDTLFFAGEATNMENQSATVHGAIATGKRVAAEVRSALAQ